MAGTYTNLLYHLVFSTKNRIPMITAKWDDELYAYMGGVIRNLGGVLIEAGGMPDHVHLLAKLKPQPAISDVLREMKASSSKWANEADKLGLRKFGWQDGYGAFTVSESEVPRVRRYIQAQEEHHRRFDFQVEFRGLLDRHNIEYDERYIWS